MAEEKSYDSSVVPQGAERFGDERMDAFMDLDERQRVWEFVAREMGARWAAMERSEKEKMVKKYTANIIIEAKTMAGGMWNKLSVEQQREVFDARFIDKTVPAGERKEAFETRAMEPLPELEPEPAPVTPEAPAALEQVHERLVEDAVELAAGIWKARYPDRKPDQKYLDEMRAIYARQKDATIEAKIDQLAKELKMVSGS